jgi:GAF domain-containing protein
MLNQVRTLFIAPTFFDNEDKTRKARYANAIALAFLTITIVYEAVIRVFMNYRSISVVDLMIFGLTVTCIASLVMLRRGQVYAASVLMVVLIWAVINSIAATGYGAQDSSFLTNFTVVLMAGLLLGWQASFIITLLSIVTGFGLAFAEKNGLISHGAYPITSFAQDIAFVFGFNAVIIYLLINGLENALKKSRASLETLELTNVDLNQTQEELQRRTAELTVVNRQLGNRTEKLQAIAAITATAASIHNFEQLISSVASIVSQRLGYYHVGLYLLDEQRQYALLRSASSEAGLRMLGHGHRLPIGQKGVVGFAAQTGQPQIALEMTASDDADLAEARSELALPLKSGAQIIGILDLQSIEVTAFSNDDISTLTILADQIGIAIQNALVYEQSQRALREANTAFRQASEKDWKGYAETLQAKGYRYDGIKPEPLKESYDSKEAGNAVAIPVQLRGQTIGQLKLKPSDASKEWTEDELAMAEATAERAALALEGARLLEEAQKRAARETFLADIAAKLSTSFQLDSILRDTVEELGQTLPSSIVSFQLINPSAPVTLETSDADEVTGNETRSE